MKLAAEEGIGDYGDAVVLRGEEAAQPRRGAQHGEERRGGESGLNVARVARGSLVGCAAGEGRHGGEDRRLLLPFDEVQPRHFHARPDGRGQSRETLPHEDQAVDIGIRKGVQHDRIEHAEDGGVGADAEGQHGNGEQ